jgi:hypothetical protein
MPLKQQIHAVSVCLVALDGLRRGHHDQRPNHARLSVFAINLYGNHQTFSNRLKFSMLKPAATVPKK